MLITLKRTFVYFLIVNYLQLTLMPSFAFAMERDEILQALPRLEPIKPSSVEERDGWEAPAVLSPAIASQALPVLTISLHRQENGSFQLKMQQTGAAVYSEFLPKGKIAKDYQGHKIDLNLGDALTSQVVFTTINPVCNYLFDIDGHLNLGGSLETQGYFKVKKANSFSLPANLLADSGLFLDNIKTLTHEGTTTPRVIAKRGAIDIRAAGDNKPLEIKAVLEARTGIRIETDTGDLVIDSILKTPSEIFLKSQRDVIFKDAQLFGLTGIGVDSKEGIIDIQSAVNPAFFITHKMLIFKGGKKIRLQQGDFLGLSGIKINAGEGILIGSDTTVPAFRTNGDIVMDATQSTKFLKCLLNAGEDIRSTAYRNILGSNMSPADLKANQQLILRSAELTINNAMLTGLKGMTAESTRRELTIGSEMSDPILYSNTSITLIGKERIEVMRGCVNSKGNITVNSREINIGCAQEKQTLREYYENYTLPLLQKICPNDHSYQTFEAFVRDAKRRTGYDSTLTPQEYLQKVWMSIPKYKKMIDDLGIVLPEYRYEKYTLPLLQKICPNDRSKSQEQLSSPQWIAGKMLNFNAEKIDLQQAEMTGLEGITLDASNGSIIVGRDTSECRLNSNGDIKVTGKDYLQFIRGHFKAGKNITAESTGNNVYVGNFISAPQLTSGWHTNLIGNQVDVINGILSSQHTTTLHSKKQAVNFGAVNAKPTLKAGQSVTITSTAPVNLKGGTIDGGAGGITLNTGANKLVFDPETLTSVLKTCGVLTLNSNGGVEILRNFPADIIGLAVNTGSKDFILGEMGKTPLNLHLLGTFSFTGAAFSPVNGNILCKGNISVQATKPVTLGGSLLIKDKQTIHPMGNGQYLMSLGHLQIKAPSLTLIGASLGGATANFETAVLTNTGGFIDIKGDVNGTMTHLTNQLMSFSLADYQKQGGLLENYRDSCLKKLPRGRIQISRNLTLPQLVKGVNVGSDVYVAGKSITKTLIQDQVYSQVQLQQPAGVKKQIPARTIFGLTTPPRSITVYPSREVHWSEWRVHLKGNQDHRHYTPEFVDILQKQGVSTPTWSEITELMDAVQNASGSEHGQRFAGGVINPPVRNILAKRQYNQSLQIKSTHSAGKGLVVPFQSQVIVHGILQTPKLAIAATSMTVGRHLQDFEPKMKPFIKVQDLSNFQVPTQLAIFTPTDPVALIHPPHLFRIDPKTLPPAVIISPNRLYLNPTLPRQYDPWFEIQQVMSAIQANLNRGYLDEATTQPEDIYRQLLKNAQDLYQQYQDQGKGKIPALQGVSQSIVFKESGTLELGQGKKIALTKPVLIYEEVALNGINSLRGSLVWPPSWEKATKSIRDNRGGIIANNILLKANTLQIDGRLHANTTGAYQTQNTVINGGTLSSGKDSTTVLQAQKLLVMQPTERVNEHGIKETVFAKVESLGRTGIEADVMEIKAGKISSTSTDPKAMLLQGNQARLGSVKTIHSIENGTKETAEVTTISSKGGTTLQFRQSLVGEAPYLEGKNLKVTAPKIEMIPVTLRQEQQWTEIKESLLKDTEKTIHKIIETNILPHYKADETITFIGNQTHTAPKIDAPKTVLTSSTGTVSLKLAPQNRQELIAEKSSDLVFNKQKIERQDHLTYLSPQITGDLSIEARKAIVETVEGLLSPKIRVKGTLTNSILSEVHNVEVKSSRTLSGLASALIALAITVGTGGSGSLLATALGLGGNTFVIGVGQALVTGTATQFTLGTLNNDFDPLKGIQTVFSKEGSLSLATSIVSSGIMGSMGITAPGYNASMTDITRYVGTKTLVSSGVNLAFNNNSLEETLRKGGINFVTDIVGVMGADYLGELYQNGKGSIDFATHKILHGVLGAGLGALKGDPLAGALGGMVAETVADLISDDVEDIAVRVYEKAEEQGIEFGSQDYNNLLEKEVQTTVNWSKVGAILAVSLAKRDIDVGVDVATNALENNFLPMVIGAVYVANLAMTTYDAYEAYQEDGVEGVVESVATDVVMGAMTGGAFKIIGKGAKVAWKGTTQKAVKNEGKDSAKNVANHEKYKERLKQEQNLSYQSEKAAEQLNELKSGIFKEIKGPGSKGEKLLIDEPRLISEYGGKPGDWNKITSKNPYKNDLGKTVETHAYRNSQTGEIVEPKLKFQGEK